MPSAMTTDCQAHSTAFLHGSCNQRSPPPPMYNSNPSVIDVQESAISNEKFADGSSMNEKHVNTTSTGKDEFIYVVTANSDFSKKVDSLFQQSERNTTASPCNSPPLLLVTGEGNMCVRLEQQAAMKLVFILVLLSTALHVLLQTNLSTPVTLHLLLAMLTGSSYLLLLARQSHKKLTCAPYAANVCFGITTFEMLMAVTVHVWGFAARSSSIGSEGLVYK